MSIKDESHYRLPAELLAQWIEHQPERWWVADGDPTFLGLVHFPCPSDELSPAIRRIGKTLLLRDQTPGSQVHGEVIRDEKQLDALVDTENNYNWKTFLLSWEDKDEDWMLVEDEPLVE